MSSFVGLLRERISFKKIKGKLELVLLIYWFIYSCGETIPGHYDFK